MSTIAIVIPTYNGASRIGSTLASIKRANRLERNQLHVYLVDNNSRPADAIAYQSLVAEYRQHFDVSYLAERKQGRSHALNLGVATAQEDVIAFVDDDETIDVEWLTVLHSHFDDPAIDYVGGPYLPDWLAPPPSWLPAHINQYKGILGWIEQAPKKMSYDEFDGTLCGGNCAMRRQVFDAVGGFNVHLGRSAQNLMGGEDGEFHLRLRAKGLRGLYDPALIVYHQIPAARMTFRYHLRWAYWSGVSNGIRIRTRGMDGQPVAMLGGIPRYWYRKAIDGCATALFATMTRSFWRAPRGLCGAMDFSYLLGLLYGRHVMPVASAS